MYPVSSTKSLKVLLLSEHARQSKMRFITFTFPNYWGRMEGRELKTMIYLSFYSNKRNHAARTQKDA